MNNKYKDGGGRTPASRALRDFNLHNKKLISVRKCNCDDDNPTRCKCRAKCTGFQCKNDKDVCGCNVKKPCQCLEDYMPKNKCRTNNRYPRSMGAPAEEHWSADRVRTTLQQLRLKICEKLEQLKRDKIGNAAKRSLRANYVGLDENIQKLLDQLRKQQVSPAQARANLDKFERILKWNSAGQDEYVDFYKDVNIGFSFWPF